MLKHRVIPALLLSEKKLVKTRQFKRPQYVGDPINAIRIFNEKEVDELMVLDITASREKCAPDYGIIKNFSSECFMPLSYGGGINSLTQAGKLFNIGIEKIVVQTAAFNNLNLITDLANEFGSQSIVISIDVKRNWIGKPKLYQSVDCKTSNQPWLDVLKKCVDAGAGEILLNAVDKDGTLSGPDLAMIKEASSELSVPLIGLGGVSSMSDIKAMVENGASAVAAGAFFVFHGPHRAVLITYPKYTDLEALFESEKTTAS